ncbi:MAG: hypothetical protein IPI19_16025 [Ignavibacteriales bacterium]|nr:hypothetical protein [Ignavibacteriales bacterium]
MAIAGSYFCNAKNENEFIEEKGKGLPADVYDHTIQVIDTIESSRMVVGMLDTYLSSTSNKLNGSNESFNGNFNFVYSATFLAGVYGMNFRHFPELGYDWMYPWGFWIITLLWCLE